MSWRRDQRDSRAAAADPLAVVNWSHVENGRIFRVMVIFDPRALLR